MARARIFIPALLLCVAALLVAACSDDSDNDDNCFDDDDCMVGWGWICVNHKCVRPDGDSDAEPDSEGAEQGVRPCSKIESEAECLESMERCIWEDKACSVRPYTPDGDSDYDYQGYDPGSDGSGCRYLDYRQCVSWPQCEWWLDSCVADSSVNPNGCSKYRTESECARGYGCEWNGYACVSIM